MASYFQRFQTALLTLQDYLFPTKFHLFPNLPPEIRLKIWEQVISTPRLYSDRYFHTIPPLLHTNHESRLIARKHLTFVDVHNFHAKTCRCKGTRGCKCILGWVNFSSDYLYFAGEFGGDLDAQPCNQYRCRLKNLVFHVAFLMLWETKDFVSLFQNNGTGVGGLERGLEKVVIMFTTGRGEQLDKLQLELKMKVMVKIEEACGILGRWPVVEFKGKDARIADLDMEKVLCG